MEKLWFFVVTLGVLALIGALYGVGYRVGRDDALEQFAAKAMEECACVCKVPDG